MDLIHTLFFFVIALGILISFHEFGHFWVARKTGVKVLRFSVGFGKVLWSKQKHLEDTEYVISAIPLGGYVKMVDEREGEVKPEDLPMAFNRQSVAVRTAIVAAGPLFNLGLAVALFWTVLVIGETGLKPIVGEIKPGTIAATAGLQEGEEIVSINGKPAKTWTDAISTLITQSIDGASELTIRVRSPSQEERDKVLQFTAEDRADSEKLFERIGLNPWSPKLKPVIKEVMPESAAMAAGLQKDDLIVSADGKPIAEWSQWVEYVKKRPDVAINLLVERNGGQVAITITPKAVTAGDKTEGKIGASVVIPEGMMDAMMTEYSLSPWEALPAAFEITYNYSVITLKMMGKMLIGEASVKNLSGPISIAQIAGQSANMGFVYFIKFLAMVSVSLGVLNLLPVPVLDGGHLLFFGIEALRGGPLSEKAQLFFQQIGMTLLFLLMATALIVDVQRLFN